MKDRCVTLLFIAILFIVGLAATGCSTLMPATHNYLTSEKVDDIREDGEGCVSYLTTSSGQIFMITGNNCGPAALE